MRAIGNNLVLNAAREVRALRAFGAGLAEPGCGEGPGWSGVKTEAIKSIVRTRPPPAPAGFSRCDQDTVARWECVMTTGYPPYQ